MSRSISAPADDLHRRSRSARRSLRSRSTSSATRLSHARAVANKGHCRSSHKVVADFYRCFVDLTNGPGIALTINEMPNEIINPIPFRKIIPTSPMMPRPCIAFGARVFRAFASSSCSAAASSAGGLLFRHLSRTCGLSRSAGDARSPSRSNAQRIHPALRCRSHGERLRHPPPRLSCDDLCRGGRNRTMGPRGARMSARRSGAGAAIENLTEIRLRRHGEPLACSALCNLTRRNALLTF